MQPLITVIVPVYNGQDYLYRCIESINMQTYRELEIIIINDGSTDETARVCQNLLQEYRNIQVITMNDEGVSAARNAGINRAKGEYITFVDADDRLLPEMIQLLYENLIEEDSDIAGCDFVEWKNEEEWQSISGRKILPEGGNRYSAQEFLTDGILKGNSRCWSKLYKRTVIDKVRFRENISIGEDMLFLIDLLPKLGKITEISYKGYGYFQNPKGAMNRTFVPGYMDQITCWEMARETISKMNPGKMHNQQNEQQITSILLMAIMLTVGKIALLPVRERRNQKKYADICHKKLKKELTVQGVFESLSREYQIKTRLFQKAPGIYICLYHLKKYL